MRHALVVAALALGIALGATQVSASIAAKSTGLCFDLNGIVIRMNAFDRLNPGIQQKEAVALAATARKFANSAHGGLKTDLLTVSKNLALYPNISRPTALKIRAAAKNIVAYNTKTCGNPNNRPPSVG